MDTKSISFTGKLTGLRLEPLAVAAVIELPGNKARVTVQVSPKDASEVFKGGTPSDILVFDGEYDVTITKRLPVGS